MFGATTRLRGKCDPASGMSEAGRRIRRCRATPAARVTAIVAAAALATAGLPAQAQKGPPIIRDAEIEQLLKEYTQPILKVAGLSQQISRSSSSMIARSMRSSRMAVASS